MNLVIVVGFIIFVLLVALVYEITCYVESALKRSKEGVYFLDLNPKLSLKQPGTLLNYDANYTYMHIPHSTNMGEVCDIIGQTISQKFRLRFNTVTAIYYFKCKHQHPTVPFMFSGPPTRHLTVIIPVTSDSHNWISIKKKQHTFRNSMCVLSPAKKSTVGLTGPGFVVAIVQPFFAWDII
jgi:hypothetical protein